MEVCPKLIPLSIKKLPPAMSSWWAGLQVRTNSDGTKHLLTDDLSMLRRFSSLRVLWKEGLWLPLLKGETGGILPRLCEEGREILILRISTIAEECTKLASTRFMQERCKSYLKCLGVSLSGGMPNPYLHAYRLLGYSVTLPPAGLGTWLDWPGDTSRNKALNTHPLCTHPEFSESLSMDL